MKNNGKALPYSSLLNNFLEARENVPDNNNMQSDPTCICEKLSLPPETGKPKL